MITYFNNEIKFCFKDKRRIYAWIKNTIYEENSTLSSLKKEPGDISIVFCTDEYLKEVNKRYLSHDYYTDIITFDSSDERTISGDLLISVERVKKNAEKFSQMYVDELHRVIIHGILHLLGYCDRNSSEKTEMRDKENYYLLKRDHI
jgi:rRNA maturation RNase YbeY